MNITFKIDMVDLFRRGTNVSSPIVSLEINPSILIKDHRELITRHLKETDDGCNVVCDFENLELVEAKNPTLESLLEALLELESQTICCPA